MLQPNATLVRGLTCFKNVQDIGFMKIIVCKIPSEGGAKPYISHAYILNLWKTDFYSLKVMTIIMAKLFNLTLIYAFRINQCYIEHFSRLVKYKV